MDRYEHGISRLAFWNWLCLFALAGITALWGFALIPITTKAFANQDVEPGVLVIPVVGIAFLMFQQSFVTFKTVVGQYGKVKPSLFLIGYGLLLLLALLFWLMEPWYGLVPCLVALIAAAKFRNWLLFHKPLWLGESGQFMRPVGWLKRYFRLQQKPGDLTLPIMGLNLPFEEGIRNIALFGAVSSGKTITLRLLLQSIVPHIGKRPNLRLIVHDAKRDMYSILRGMNPHCPIYLLNPADARCAVLNLGQLITNQAGARALATVFTPSTTGSHDTFWILATQYMLEGLAVYFATVAPGKWDLRDLLVACRSHERLKAILGSHPLTKGYLTPLEGDRLTQSVMVTIQVYLSLFAPIASAWHAKRKHAEENNLPLQELDLQQALHGNLVIVLGRDVEHPVAIAALNRLFLTLYGRALLNAPGNDMKREPRTFFVLDEFHTIGNLPEFEEFMTNASGRGVSVVTALQSISSLQRIYGREGTEAILGQCFHRLFLRLNDQFTAEYASVLFGLGSRFSKFFNGSRWEISNQTERAPLVSPEQLRRIAPPMKGRPGPLNWLFGVGGSPLKGAYLGTHACELSLSPRAISKKLMPKADVPDIVAWGIPPLPGWDLNDLRRLHLEQVIGPDDFVRQQQEEQNLMAEAAACQKVVLQNIKPVVNQSFSPFPQETENSDSPEDPFPEND